MALLSVVVPVHNEQQNISPFCQRIKNTFTQSLATDAYEVIFVDDGSTDDSWSTIDQANHDDNCIKGIQLTKNFGQHIAIAAGLRAAQGDAVVVMDGDLQDLPESIPDLYHRLRDSYDVVYAKKQHQAVAIQKRALSWAFNRVVGLATRKNVEIRNSTFCIMTREAKNHIIPFTQDFRYFPGIIGHVGLQISEVPVQRPQRSFGKSKYTLRHQWRLGMNALFLFGDRLIPTLAVVSCILLVLVSTIVFINTAPWVRYLLIVVFGVLQLIAVYCIAEFNRRKFIEQKERPLYTIRQTIGISETFNH